MKVCVAGLWHLGTVTAACLGSIGHNVSGYDPDQGLVDRLRAGELPVDERGLAEMTALAVSEESLAYFADRATALEGCDVLWITCDTPVDDDDVADVDYVNDMVRAFFPLLRSGMTVIVSSQLPVGSTGALARDFKVAHGDLDVHFVSIPENLRLGNALKCFLEPDRFVVGVCGEASAAVVSELLAPITDRIEWMSLESAEMTKHAINAFLATSVAFANEIAVICEHYGADAKEVERGLKSEERIGPKAYLSPGSAFSGGTLARDINFLSDLAQKARQSLHLLPAVRASNDEHRGWVRRKLVSVLGSVSGKKIAIWGLTYKPGTNTLRRSLAIELARWLTENGATVVGHDPSLPVLPEDAAGSLTLSPSAQECAIGADALVVSTEWPDYKEISVSEDGLMMRNRVVVDPNRFLDMSFGKRSDYSYYTIGRSV